MKIERTFLITLLAMAVTPGSTARALTEGSPHDL
jgi:hypothetical protein